MADSFPELHYRGDVAAGLAVDEPLGWAPDGVPYRVVHAWYDADTDTTTAVVSKARDADLARWTEAGVWSPEAHAASMTASRRTWPGLPC